MLNDSQRRVNKNSLTWWYILKTSWRYLCKTSWRCLEDVFQEVLKTFWRRLEDVLKRSWRLLEDVWPRRIYWSWPRRLEDVFWRRKAKANIFVLIKTSWRGLQDVFWRRRRNTSSSRRMFAGHMCNRVLLLLGKLPQWNFHVNCHVNGTTFQSGLSSLRVSCKCALILLLLSFLLPVFSYKDILKFN